MYTVLNYLASQVIQIDDTNYYYTQLGYRDRLISPFEKTYSWLDCKDSTPTKTQVFANTGFVYNLDEQGPIKFFIVVKALRCFTRRRCRIVGSEQRPTSDVNQ